MQRIDLSAETISVKVENGVRRFQVGDGEPFRLDIATAWDRWVELLRQAEEIRKQAGNADLPYVQFLIECSRQPDIMQKCCESDAIQFVGVLEDCAVELKKNMRAQRGLPASTDSTPSAVPPGN